MSFRKKLYSFFRVYRHRRNYWSCSKAAEWIRKIFGVPPKPFAATLEGWKDYKEQCKDSSRKVKFGYWLSEDGLDWIQDIALYPHDVYYAIKTYLKNRYVTKTHLLSTNLTPGTWYDLDTRLLYGCFTSLVDFVEEEKVHMWRFMSKNERPKFSSKEEAGIAYIDWEISLGDESPSQAQSAKEIKELYLWWKHERPNRIDPWSDEYNGDDPLTLETEQYQEDTAMLVRLINVRRDLWT